MIGYQLDDADITSERKEDFKITSFHRETIRNTSHCEHIMAGASPFRISNMCLPIPDTKDPVNALFGIFKRVACKPPMFTFPKGRRHFSRYVRRFIYKSGISKLQPSDVPTFEEWLSKTHYSESRKSQLRTAREAMERLDDVSKIKIVEAHNKWEFYDKIKPNRFVNARNDMAKCYIGPIFWAISKTVNHLPWFVKHYGFHERSKVIKKLLGKAVAKYCITDYTSFESQFIKEAMEMIEFELYKFMVDDLPGKDHYLNFFNEVLAGVFTIQYEFFNMKIEATRMSGEMNTSLGNGFANLLLFYYAVHLQEKIYIKELNSNKHIETVIKGFVEGDDGVFLVEPPECIPTAELLSSLGFNLKIEVVDSFAEVSTRGTV